MINSYLIWIDIDSLAIFNILNSWVGRSTCWTWTFNLWWTSLIHVHHLQAFSVKNLWSMNKQFCQYGSAPQATLTSAFKLLLSSFSKFSSFWTVGISGSLRTSSSNVSLPGATFSLLLRFTVITGTRGGKRIGRNVLSDSLDFFIFKCTQRRLSKCGTIEFTIQWFLSYRSN